MSGRRGTFAAACVALAWASATCGGAPAEDALVPHPHDAFIEALATHCGKAYEGRITLRPDEDTLFTGDETLIVHFRECEPRLLKLPFHVEDNRSRTWILARTDSGIDLRHDHRHRDGTPDDVTMYGAHTAGDGSAARQEFLRPPDGGAATGWAIEVDPGRRYTYGTLRDGAWRYRLDFDLTTEVPAPPPPWGHPPLADDSSTTESVIVP